MSIGFLALLDDIAALAKVAAASIEDVAGPAAKAGAKAAGVVIDDAAVTPRYAVGSLRNKLLILLPVALAPWAITSLLMLGGAYLAYEGTEEVCEAIFPHGAHEHDAHIRPVAATPHELEVEKVASAIKTDFILSADIMAIMLAALPAGTPRRLCAMGDDRTCVARGIGLTALAAILCGPPVAVASPSCPTPQPSRPVCAAR